MLSFYKLLNITWLTWLYFYLQENILLKQQIEVLIQENTVLKRAVAIQHERQKEYQDKNHELQHLKQLVSQYQEQLRTLEVTIKIFDSSSFIRKCCL